jgi:alanine racemase
MIMGHIDHEELEWAIEHDIEFFVFDVDRLGKAVSEAKNKKRKHIFTLKWKQVFIVQE